MFKEKIIREMKVVFKEIPFGIDHTLKVLQNAEDIMKGENIGDQEKKYCQERYCIQLPITFIMAL